MVFACTSLRGCTMHLRLTMSALLSLAFVSSICAQEPSKAKLGEKMPNLTFKDDKGKTYRLYELENQKAIVLAFLSFECPVAKSYMTPLSEIAKEFSKAGVTVWSLTTNDDDTPAQIAKSAKEFDLAFPVFKDERLRAADALKAE